MPQATYGGISAQNIPHGPVYSALFALPVILMHTHFRSFQRPYWVKTTLLLSVMLCYSGTATAAAPVYFDIFGFIFWIGGFLLGFIALCLIAVKSRPGRMKAVLWILVWCYLPAPFAWIGAEKAIQESRQHRMQIERAADFERSKEQGREALYRFCAEQKSLPVCQQLTVKNGG
jgi:uncharacterized membrane protein YgdD (TMEM256/DUF423 family)